MGIREPFNTVTHGLGILAAVAGLVFLVWQAESAMATTAYAIYGGTLVLVYLASTTYHALPLSERGMRILRRIDHSAVFLVIAGSYTPVCLLALPPGWGWSIFGVIWGLTAVGIVTKNIYLDLPSWGTAAIYLAMGWTAVVAVQPMIEVFSWTALAWLAAGGLAYTVGAIIYAAEWPDPLPDRVGYHGIWHLFVLAGSGAHFVFMAGFVPNA